MENDTPEFQETVVYFGSEARKRLYAGVKVAADAVGATMGPRGRTVLIQKRGGSPILTKDGVTVSKSVKPTDPVERMGAELVLEAASRTNDVAGDGTTTSTVLTHALIQEGMRLLEAGYSAKNLVEGMNLGVREITRNLVSLSQKIETREQVEHVGTISANGDKSIGSIIADAMEKVGADGIVSVEDAKGMMTTLDHVEGLQFDRGYVSPYFATNAEKMNCVYQDVRALVTDRKISLIKDILPVLEDAVRNRVALLIIADDVEGEALQALVLNKQKNDLKVVAVKAPGYGRSKDLFLQDICVLAGTQLVSPSNGNSLEKIRLNDLGKLKRVVSDNKSTTLVGTGATTKEVEEHVNVLRQQLQDITLDANEINLLRMRIAKLSSGVAIIKVGGSTEVEMLERKYRIEDALHATRAAAEEGIVPGGGMALIRSLQSLQGNSIDDHEVKAGLDIVVRACQGPIRKIVTNGGGSPDVVLQKISDGTSGDSWWGYNASTEEYVNLLEVGVIDPVKVTRTALENARSVATSFLTLDAVICEPKS